jgi:hypothetical protein
MWTWGFLVWDKNASATSTYNIGSRLKTPVLPLWVTRCNDVIGILFNPNKDLLRSHNAEKRSFIFGIHTSWTTRAITLCLSLSLSVSLCLSLSLSASSRTYLSPLSVPSISRSLSISIYLRIRNSMLLRGWLIYCWTSYFIQIKDRQADWNCPGHLYLSIDQSIYLIFCKKYGMFF